MVVKQAGSHNRHIILHEAEEGGYWVECPSLEGCVSQGDTLEEALANIKEAIELYIETLLDDGESVPDDHAVYVAKVVLVS